MNTTGKLKTITTDFETHRRLLTFEVDHVTDEELNRLYGLDTLDITADKHRKKRSLNANAYFHVLVGKIADAMIRSKTRIKNEMIEQYGQELITDEGRAFIKTQISKEEAYEMEVPHLKFIKWNEEDNTNFYVICRGSHTYDTKEMSVLIEGTVDTAKELGIETLAPAELQRMMEMWKPKKEELV